MSCLPLKSTYLALSALPYLPLPELVQHYLESALLEQHEAFHGYVVKKKKVVSDVIIETSDQKFIRGHKIVLAATSPVLKELLLSAEGDTIVLPFKAEEVKKVMKFVYSGAINIFKGLQL